MTSKKYSLVEYNFSPCFLKQIISAVLAFKWQQKKLLSHLTRKIIMMSTCQHIFWLPLSTHLTLSISKRKINNYKSLPKIINTSCFKILFDVKSTFPVFKLFYFCIYKIVYYWHRGDVNIIIKFIFAWDSRLMQMFYLL